MPLELQSVVEVLSPVQAYLQTRIEVLWARFLGATDRLSLAQLSATLVLAALILGFRTGQWRPGALLKATLPSTIYWTRSSLLDLQIYLTNAVGRPTYWLMFGLSVGWLSRHVTGLLTSLFGEAPTVLPVSMLTVGIVGFAMLLATDFSTYAMHRLAHELRPLWAFHRLHHSAPVLTPLTVNRKHPVGEALGNLVVIAILGPLNGLLAWIAAPDLSQQAAEVVATGYAAFGWLAGNLRHSHVPLSFGPVLERIFISPVMHQMHHSTAPEHWGRNFGEIFAIWDWAFGTLARPAPDQQPLRFGLSDDPSPHTSWRSAMLEPFTYLLQGREPENAVVRPGIVAAQRS